MVRIQPDEPQRDPMPFRRQAETAGGGETQRLGVADNFAEHTSEIAAPHPFFQREQHIFRLFGDHMDDPVPQVGGQSRAIGPSGQFDRSAVLHP